MRGVGRRRVHRGAGFADHGLGRGAGAGGADVGDEFGCQRIGFPRCGAVADRDQLDAVPGDQRGQRGLGGVPLLLRLVREHRAGVEHLARAVDDRDLDPGAEAGIKSQRGAVTGGRGEQQVFEVAREHRDGVLLGSQP